MISTFPAIGSQVEFSTREGGTERKIRGVVVEDQRADEFRVAIQPNGSTVGGRKPAVVLRNRRKVDPVF